MKRILFALMALAMLGGLAFAGDAGAQAAPNSTGNHVCVESTFVQEAPEATLLAVGNEFFNGDHTYMIIGGPPTCRLNCFEGLDFNCDGKLGDPCVVGGLIKVSAVKKCLAATAPASAPASAPALGTGGGAAPVALATTGVDSDALAQAALMLIAVGAGSSGMARRRRINRRR